MRANAVVGSIAKKAQKHPSDFADLKQNVIAPHAKPIVEPQASKALSKASGFQLHNRRYIGSKAKLADWILQIMAEECEGQSFADIFAGTGIVALRAGQRYKKIIVNDFLYSNEAIYYAFLGNAPWDNVKLQKLIDEYSQLDPAVLPENYFSENFGGKYFDRGAARLIGHIREDLETTKRDLSTREYYILLASLLYSADKIANTVGHYDAYFKKDPTRTKSRFVLLPVIPHLTSDTQVYREDANTLAKRIKADITYIDPPYNSRQYSRFYHVLETLTKWDKPELFGTALKPEPENMSDYCRVSARERFRELVNDLQSNYLVVSYNNTYESKSKSSENKIKLEEIKAILDERGSTKVFEKKYRHFNAGNTNFKDHKEYLFVCKVNHV